MSIRVRKDGTMICAALSEPKPDDAYIDDALHYQMSVVHGVICTYPEPEHTNSGGKWFWSNSAPDGADMTFSKAGER